jgi:hypothetical protein
MKTKSFSAAVRRAYLFSHQHRLDILLEERRKWQRRQTIASNKLADAQRRLDELLNTYVQSAMEGK